jgi:hypothetical protein
VTGQDGWRDRVKFSVTQKQRNLRFTPKDNNAKVLEGVVYYESFSKFDTRTGPVLRTSFQHW